jgi:hypothetical protein
LVSTIPTNAIVMIKPMADNVTEICLSEIILLHVAKSKRK